MWKLIEKPKVVTATKALAKYFADMEPAPNDRPLRESRMQVLRNVIKEGQFRTGEWASVTCKETGKEYRVNGKHTSTILNEMNGEFQPIHITLARFEADTLEDVARLYGTFDTKESTRSVGDISRSVAAANTDLATIPTKTINLAVVGLAFEQWGLNMHKQQPLQRCLLMLDSPDVVLFIDGLFHGDYKHISRGPVVAAIVKTYRKHQGQAEQFWEAVRDGDGKVGSPERTLEKFLNRCTVNLGGGSIPKGKKIVGFKECHTKCLHAWNAWRRDTTTDLKYFENAPIPAAV